VPVAVVARPGTVGFAGTEASVAAGSFVAAEELAAGSFVVAAVAGSRLAVVVAASAALDTPGGVVVASRLPQATQKPEPCSAAPRRERRARGLQRRRLPSGASST